MPILISQLAMKPALTAALTLYLLLMGASALLLVARPDGIHMASAFLPEPVRVSEPATRTGTDVGTSLISWSGGTRTIAEASSAGNRDISAGQEGPVLRSSIP